MRFARGSTHWVPLALAVSLVVPKEGAASQIHFKETTLQEVAERAPLVVEVLYRKDADEDARGWLRFEVLKAHTPGAKTAHGTIRVWQASVAEWAHAKRVYESTGTMFSPLVSQLPPTDAATLVDGERYILFLGPGEREGEHVLFAENAYVTPARFEKVRTTVKRLAR